jgi:hypothetical protein
VAKRLAAARKAFLDVVDFVAGSAKASPNAVYAGSVPYLMLAGNLVAGWQMGARCWCRRSCPPGTGRSLHAAKIATARSTPTTSWCVRRACATASWKAQTA